MARKDSLNLAGWSARGAARMRRRQAEAERVEVEPLLPDRVSMLELGQRQITFLRPETGRSELGKADDLVNMALIDRALSGHRQSVVQCYRRLDKEEDASLANPVRHTSKKLRREVEELLKVVLGKYAAVRDQLIDQGLAVDRDGMLRIAPEVLARAHARQFSK